MTYPKEPEFRIVYDIVDYINNNAKTNGATEKDVIILAYYLKSVFNKKFDDAFEEMIQEHMVKEIQQIERFK